MNMDVGTINCFTAPTFRRSDYDALFDSALDQLRDERRYRDFVDLERLAGQFPHAIWHSPVGPRQVVIWCSNDYLGMAQHPNVVGAMVEAASRMGTGAGGTRNIAGTNHSLIELERELAKACERDFSDDDALEFSLSRHKTIARRWHFLCQCQRRSFRPVNGPIEDFYHRGWRSSLFYLAKYDGSAA